MEKDLLDMLIWKIDKLTEKVEAMTESLNKENVNENKPIQCIDLEEFFNNEFIFTINYEGALKRRVNVYRKGNEVGSISIDELEFYLNQEINDIIDNEILKRYK